MQFTSVANTPKKIDLIATCLNEFTSTYYDDKNFPLKYFFNTIKLVLLTTFITHP